MDPATAVIIDGGIAHRRRILALGSSGNAITRAVSRGALIRLRRGWYSVPPGHSDYDPDAVAILLVGGRVGGATALSRLGVWIPRRSPLVASLPPNASRLGSTDDRVVRVWSGTAFGDPGAPMSWVERSRVAIDQVLSTSSLHEGVAVLDSALREQVIGQEDADRLARSHGIDPRRLDPRAEAGAESILRSALLDRGVVAVPQVRVPGIARIDLVVGDRLAIEIDGRQFHDGADHFGRDRRRGLTVAAVGFVELRTTSDQVEEDLDSTLDAIMAVVERGEHRRIPWGVRYSGRSNRHA